MSRFKVIIIAWTIEFGWLVGNEIVAILTMGSLTQFDPGNLGDRIPFFGWLQWPGEQSALRNVIGALATVLKPYKCRKYFASYDYNAE